MRVAKACAKLVSGAGVNRRMGSGALPGERVGAMKKIAMGVALGLLVGLAARMTVRHCSALCETCGCKGGCCACRRDEEAVGDPAV
jgi:hypothetical protein